MARSLKVISSNKLLEELVTKYSGWWDEPFYREVISPNIYHILTIHAEMEFAFRLAARGQRHALASLSKELKDLLSLYKDEELHKFISGQSFSHIPQNLIGCDTIISTVEIEGFYQRKSEIC